jgi:MoaA/NifB/PqqE/SkfB family radical SAM enzyme
MTAHSIATASQASSCYFRTTTDGHHRKALVQIDERCNLHCAHCFVSATRRGATMAYQQITDVLIPRLAACRVERVTLTGGEPTIHPQFLDVVRAFRSAGMAVGICTNATTLDAQQISELARIGGVHCNVSIDGFRPESHGKFRGDQDSFDTTVATVRALAAAGLLQGLLCTPNSLAEDGEYRELCEFAAENGAGYVLMNPLSSMGRGVKTRGRLAATQERMRHIHELTAPFQDRGLDMVHIRFPVGSKPLAGCQAGTIIYVFTPGEVTVCPYLVFAARLDAYHFTRRYRMGANPTCGSCGMASSCGKGCPAAVISAGERIGAVDAEVCPVTAGERRLLSLMPA